MKASEIAGFMPEKKEEKLCTCGISSGCGCEVYDYNHAIYEMSSKELDLDRDELTKLICDSRYGEGAFIRWKQINTYYANSLIESLYKDADAILANLKDLLIVKKG